LIIARVSGTFQKHNKKNIFFYFVLAICKRFCYYSKALKTVYWKQAHKMKEVQQMAKCDVCGKGVSFGIQVSHSHRRSNRTWKPNIKRVKAVVNGTPTHVYVCSRCLRSGKVTRA
jgi:large subunit ribosomal protein L28